MSSAATSRLVNDNIIDCRLPNKIKKCCVSSHNINFYCFSMQCTLPFIFCARGSRRRESKIFLIARGGFVWLTSLCTSPAGHWGNVTKKARAQNAGLRKLNAVSCPHRAGFVFTGQASHICVHTAQMMVLEVMQCGNKCAARNAKMLADIRATSSKVVGLPFFRAQKQTNMSARMQTCLSFCQINEKGCEMNSWLTLNSQNGEWRTPQFNKWLD